MADPLYLQGPPDDNTRPAFDRLGRSRWSEWFLQESKDPGSDCLGSGGAVTTVLRRSRRDDRPPCQPALKTGDTKVKAGVASIGGRAMSGSPRVVPST